MLSDVQDCNLHARLAKHAKVGDGYTALFIVGEVATMTIFSS